MQTETSTTKPKKSAAAPATTTEALASTANPARKVELAALAQREAEERVRAAERTFGVSESAENWAAVEAARAAVDKARVALETRRAELAEHEQRERDAARAKREDEFAETVAKANAWPGCLDDDVAELLRLETAVHNAVTRIRGKVRDAMLASRAATAIARELGRPDPMSASPPTDFLAQRIVQTALFRQVLARGERGSLAGTWLPAAIAAHYRGA